jgi:regulation of enolase protein 1 (concanavalin A-like superfamily)
VALVVTTAAPVAAATYYVSPTGNNFHGGTSPSDAWKTIEAVNAHDFNPGDQILFEGGNTFSGNVYFDASDAGSSSSPIVVSSYGSGRATIYATNGNGIEGYDTAGFRIEELYIVGSGRDVNTGSGIFFYNDKAGDVLLDYLHVDHVDAVRFGHYGVEIGGYNGGSGFQDVRITYTIASENGLGGIYTYAARRAVHRNVYVGNSSAFLNFGFAGLEYNSGNGITLAGVDGGTIERSVAHDNGSRSDADNGPVGIWTFSSNHVVIQFCESYSNKTGGTKDGGGFHLDNSTSNSTLQYNYSHDNAGAGYMLAHKYDDYVHTGNVIRWNVSQNDARKNNYAAIHLWGRIRNAKIYNNTIYLGSGNSAARALHARNNTIETQDLENVLIANNIIQTTGNALVDFTSAALDHAAGVTLVGNEYWSTGGTFKIAWKGVTYSSLAAFRKATGQERLNGTDVGVSVDPGLRSAGKGPSFNNALMIGGLWQYRLKASSPLIDAGVDVAARGASLGSRDFFGGASKAQSGNDIGAHEWALDCQWTVSPTSASVPLSGGSGSVSVWAPATSCGWAAVPSASWISSASWANGQGTSTFTVSPSSAARTGTIKIGDQTFTVSQGGGSSTPPPGTGDIGAWQQGDVGDTGVAGGASGDGSSFTVDGGGADIWGTADAFHFVAQPVSGDWEIETQVTSVENVNAWTKAGLMIRETLDAGSKHAAIYVTPGKGLSFQYRASTNGTSAAIAAGSGTAPKWIKLARTGSTFTAYVKASDGSWTKVASTTITMASGVEIGLAVSSHDASRLATATFASVTARAATSTPPPPPATIGNWTHQDIGAVARAGTASGTDTSLNVTGSGADIWGTADAFHFVWQQVTGDMTIDAQVSTVENVNAWTKAGVMIRETLAVGSKHAAMYVTPGKGLSFQYRSTTNGTSAAATALTGTAPRTVRLVRSGSTITAYVDNGSGGWTTVASTTISMTSQVYVGVVVSSHDNSQLATAQFDNVTVMP